MYPKILTYHSHRNTGTGYGSNDHEAFAQDVAALLRNNYRIVPLWEIAQRLLSGRLDTLPQRCVALTVDDGCVYDVEHDHSERFGERRSMLAMAQAHGRRWLAVPPGRPKVCFTSFVIASPLAREQIAGNSHNYLRGDWWAAAQSSGYIDIGTHSWNHVHPCVAEVNEQTPTLKAAFHLIATEAEAHKQLIQATQTVHGVTGNRAARLFAYPYGQRGDFLVRDFLPRQKEIVAAFTVDGKPVTPDTSRWEIPRYMCNEHWHSPTELIQRLEIE